MPKNKNLIFLKYIQSLSLFPKGEILKCVVEYTSVSYLLYQTATTY